MQLVGLVVALLVLGGCGGTSTGSTGSTGSTHAPRDSPAPTTSTTARGPAHLTRTRCADLVVLGLRGQGQSSRDHDGAGRDVDGVARSMVSQLPRGTSVRIDGVPFPSRSGADATYSQDVRTGVRLVHDRVATLAAGCPSSHVALLGYSQGAEVVHRSAVALDDPARVEVVVLMGDPQRDPDDRVTTLPLGGDALGGRGNAGPGTRFPDSVRQRVLEVCAPGDDVCNAPPTGRIGPPSLTHHAVYKVRRFQRLVAAEAVRVAVGADG